MNFLIAIGLGSVVIFFLMNLVGYASVKTGVPIRCSRDAPGGNVGRLDTKFQPGACRAGAG